jgi:hypothetical protein
VIRPFNEVLLPIPENRQRIIAPRALLRSQGLDATELYPEAPELAHSCRRAVAQMAPVVSAVRRYRDVGQKTAKNPYSARPSYVSFPVGTLISERPPDSSAATQTPISASDGSRASAQFDA